MKGPADSAPVTVAVVVTAYNHAHFLADALRSIAAQTRPADRVIVVDDGSADDPGAAAARWPEVELIRQDNRGLAAARNAGLAAVQSDYVLFLDADDILSADAIERHLQCMARNPGSGLVHGGYRMVDAALSPIGPPRLPPAGAEPAYHRLLRVNFIGMHGAVFYDRAKLAALGGFDAGLRRCEDYDAYFRMAQAYPVASHGAVVADYRMHEANMSAEYAVMCDTALAVQARYRPAPGDAAGLAAYRAGRKNLRRIYGNAAWRERGSGAWRQRWAMTRRSPAMSAAAAAWRLVRPLMPGSVQRAVRRRFVYGSPAVGAIDMGDLARTTPISPGWGDDRGTPIDRLFIEGFLAAHGQDIRGRALEIAEDDYCRRFGTGVTRQDILHVTADNPYATIVGDMSQPGVLPSDAFDCQIITQTLHLIYDMPAALEQLKRSLAPGGVLLLTVPGVSSVCRGEWNECWYWSLTGQSARIMFEGIFGAGNVEVTVRGNVYAATCFLHGMAVEEADRDMLEEDDFAYPMVICVRARRGD